MDYKKLYNEAIERAKKHCADYVVETIFPELKESEDEKIRKAIGYAIGQSTHSDGTLINGVSSEEALAWLEKQGEHAKFCESIQVGDKVTRNQDGVLVNLSQLKRVAKPTEEYNICGIGSKHAEGKLGEMIKNLKPAWSEEDKAMIGNIRSIIEKYAFSQSAVDVNGELCEQEYIDADNWLKSLRPQNRWKPSEEQMGALWDSIKHNLHLHPVLESLYNDLKKLKQ